MTEAMPFLQKYDITFLRPPTISGSFPFHGKEFPIRIFCNIEKNFTIL